MRHWLLSFLMLFSYGLYAAADPIQATTQNLPPETLPSQEPGTRSLTSLDTLIAATEETLEAQRKVRQMARDYQRAKAIYLQDPQNRQRITQLVKMAHLLLGDIKAYSLLDAFDPEFLGELSYFSQIATKQKR